ncbi:SAM-dependent methyltransferase [Mucilaginibacter sp. HMF5004]|uniref:HsdM family class I SAM-dependent methyltransferase n=1 Tax=Mucilaginibacter rivuli TaxID=2857527 RepID=UPI001C5E67A0|nr:N-6 DNA methylase [Mucilaginibacter rivuli]MBW4889189.1 SAM-dependent methyltransferase [Mucilaginibacter rivuli]
MTSEQKKLLGAYYTPEPVTDALCSWAIKRPTDIILEPSFGGCNFLTSSLVILTSLGNANPEQNIYGFDIDTSAFELLKTKGIESANFIYEDFLYSDTQVNQIQVDVIIGNPPYLPIHKLNTKYKENLYSKFKRSAIKIPRRSSLWVYFIVHSFQYLMRGGKMAWVVPDSISFTDYGKHLLNELAKVFTSVELIRTDERYFYDVGTHEKTALLLCENYQNGTTKVKVFEYDTLNEVLKAIRSKKKKITAPKAEQKAVQPSGFSLVKLGDIFTTRIGIVIGATKLLAYKKKQAFNSAYYPEYFYPVITKGKQLSNLVINRKAILKNEELPIYLFDAIKLEEKEPIRFKEFIDTFPQEILINQTFRNRKKLFGYDDYNHPDAFLTYFSQGLPKLIINIDKELNCTNSVHRLYLKDKFRNQPWVMQLVSVQLFCEFLRKAVTDLARQYGNKIKKFEPSDAQKIPILIPSSVDAVFINELQSVFEQIITLIEINKYQEAKDVGNSYLTKLIFLPVLDSAIAS